MRYILRNILISIAIIPSILMAKDGYIVETHAQSLEFEVVNGLVLIPLLLDNHEATFILDSGTSSVIINSNEVRSDIVFQSVNDDLPAESITIRRLSFGPLKKKNIPAYEMNLDHVEKKIKREIDGIIGSSIFLEHDVLLDFKTQSLIFIDHRHLNDFVSGDNMISMLDVELIGDLLPVVNLKIDGQMKRMAFDTGAAINVLHHDSPEEKVSEKTIESGYLKVIKAQFIQAELNFINDPTNKGIDGIVSSSSLNADQIIISLKRKKVFLIYSKDRLSKVN